MTDFVEGFGEVKIDNVNLTSSTFFKRLEDLVPDKQHLQSCGPASNKGLNTH